MAHKCELRGKAEDQATEDGTMSQFPTKASAWRAAKALRHSLENQVSTSTAAPTVIRLVEQYRTEKMPKRTMTRQGYNTWLNHYIVPTWGNCTLQELQARPIDLWMQSLNARSQEQGSHPWPCSRSVGLRNVAR